MSQAHDEIIQAMTTALGAKPNNLVLSTLDKNDSTYMLTLNSYFPPKLVFGTYGARATLQVMLNNATSPTSTYPLVPNLPVTVLIPAGTTQVYANLINVQLVPGTMNAIATSF